MKSVDGSCAPPPVLARLVQASPRVSRPISAANTDPTVIIVHLTTRSLLPIRYATMIEVSA